MLCEKCQRRDATVHLTSTTHTQGAGEGQVIQQERHFCEQCADGYFAATAGMNSMRGLICLSDSYRSKLYDLLEATYPAAFEDDENPDLAVRASKAEAVANFLRQQLQQAKIEVNEDAFVMLHRDFIGSHYFYTRKDKFKKRKR